MGAIAAILKVATPSTANATSYASGSYTPAASRLLIAGVQASRGSSTDPPTPTLAGNGLTWALAQDPVTLALADNLFQAAGTLRDRLCVFRALTGASPSTGAVTATYGATCTGCTIIVAEIDLGDLTDPFVQMRMVAVGASDATVSMDAFEDADNAVISFFAVDANATIVGEHSELADITYATPAREQMAQFLNVADTSPSATWTGANTAGGIALELRQAAGGPTTHFGSSSLTLSANVASSGFKKTFGSSTQTLAFSFTSAAYKKTFGSSSQTLAFGFVSAGVARKFGASSQTLTFGFASAGHAKKFGASSLPVVFTFDSNGVIVPPGPVTQFGSSTLPLAVNIASAGLRTTFGSSTLPVVFAFDTDGIVRGKVFGSSSLTLTLAVESTARLKAFASSSLPIVFTFTSNGTASGPAPDVVPATVTIQNAAQLLTGAVVSLLDATGIMVVVADPAEVELSTETLPGATVSVVETVP